MAYICDLETTGLFGIVIRTNENVLQLYDMTGHLHDEMALGSFISKNIEESSYLLKLLVFRFFIWINRLRTFESVCLRHFRRPKLGNFEKHSQCRNDRGLIRENPRPSKQFK